MRDVCSHLLHHQLVCLPGLDLSAAAAPQKKVGRKKKVQVELQSAAAAQSGENLLQKVTMFVALI